MLFNHPKYSLNTMIKITICKLIKLLQKILCGIHFNENNNLNILKCIKEQVGKVNWNMYKKNIHFQMINKILYL